MNMTFVSGFDIQLQTALPKDRVMTIQVMHQSIPAAAIRPGQLCGICMPYQPWEWGH